MAKYITQATILVRQSINDIPYITEYSAVPIIKTAHGAIRDAKASIADTQQEIEWVKSASSKYRKRRLIKEAQSAINELQNALSNMPTQAPELDADTLHINFGELGEILPFNHELMTAGYEQVQPGEMVKVKAKGLLEVDSPLRLHVRMYVTKYL